MVTNKAVTDLIRQALAEDLGTGDITSEATIPAESTSEAVILAKQHLVLAGIDVAREVFRYLDPGIQFSPLAKDSDVIHAGTEIARLSGNTRALLAGERVALNLLQHMSGIATLTAAYVNKIKGLKAEILDTRKTLPGLRQLEKYAVRMGGGKNHRMGLYDMILIKDNHIKAAGSITKAMTSARKKSGQLKIEVETGNLNEVREALASKADIIMLDNMPLDLMSEAVKIIKGQALVEASGNVTLETIRAIAETGVDYISSGSLTHSAPAADISMKIK
ncbi:MAG: nicotinate-nucleotide diphosphorylase (carboxylating) [Nitrospirae bacterium GWC2_56_14]|nr:MAG: nicotinate-nucleotide diphosphorylase (carboxylating) [Nitrospirae bacterium GWC2_56_14]